MSLPRRTPLRTRKPFGSGKSEAAKARDAARKLRKWQERFLSLERVYVVQRMTCIVYGCGRSPCEVAHGRDRTWRSTNPICPLHHRLLLRSYHGLGSQEAFERELLAGYGEGAGWDHFAHLTNQYVVEHGERIVELGKLSGEWDRFIERSPAWLRKAA